MGRPSCMMSDVNENLNGHRVFHRFFLHQILRRLVRFSSYFYAYAKPNSAILTSAPQGYKHALKTNKTDTVQMTMQPKQRSQNSEYAMDWTIRCSILFSKNVQKGSQVHPASYPMGTRALPSGVERAKRKADQLVQRSEMKSDIPQHLLYVSKVCTQTAFVQLRHTSAVAGN